MSSRIDRMYVEDGRRTPRNVITELLRFTLVLGVRFNEQNWRKQWRQHGTTFTQFGSVKVSLIIFLNEKAKNMTCEDMSNVM